MKQTVKPAPEHVFNLPVDGHEYCQLHRAMSPTHMANESAHSRRNAATTRSAWACERKPEKHSRGTLNGCVAEREKMGGDAFRCL